MRWNHGRLADCHYIAVAPKKPFSSPISILSGLVDSSDPNHYKQDEDPMGQRFRVAPKLFQDIPSILKLSKTESCSILLMRIGDRKEEEYQRYQGHATGELQHFPADDGTFVYPIASVTKLLIAVALHLIMDVYRSSGKPEHEKYQRLDRWNQHYVEALNSCSPNKMEPLPGNPTIQHLLVHYKGLPDVNRFILAPNGQPLMSRKDFIKIVPHLSRSAGRKQGDRGWLEYSNGNYILIGILIEAVSGMPLGQFLENSILEPLNMDRTYVDAKKLGEVEASRAHPYVANKDDTRMQIEDRLFTSNTIEIAALGIYSCTRDLARLYETLLPTPHDHESYKFLPKKSVERLFGYNDTDSRQHMSIVGGQKWAAIGLVATTNSLQVGSRSINRLVLSDNKASSFVLGTGPKKHDLEVCYQAGSISTFSCCCYVLSESNEVAIVMSNTLGWGDPADYIARLILQDRDDLKVRRLLGYRRVDVVEKARRGCDRFFQIWRESWANNDKVDDPTILGTEKLMGLYKDEQFLQSIEIKENEGELSVEIIGDTGRSGQMRLARSGKGKLRICPKVPSIDSFGSWKNLELYYEHGSHTERVSCLSTMVTLGKTQCRMNYILQSTT